MAKITLARALKIKNRLNGRFSQVSEDIRNDNAQIVQPLPQQKDGEAVYAAPEVNVQILFARREDLREAILTIKLLINAANAPIQKLIYEIAELKGDITFLDGLNTTHGSQQNVYASGSVQWVAFKRKADIDREKRALEVKVDGVQEQIDRHNHETLIEVPDKVLDLIS